MTRKSSLIGAFSRGVFPHQVSWLLEMPLRKLIVSPETIAERSGLLVSSTVLEIGPGSGFFSRHFASRLRSGRLELLDLQFEMLKKAKKKLHGFDNVGYTVADARQPPYEDATFDVVIMVSVLGEVPDPETCLSSVYKVLRPSGRLLCHESFPDPDLIRFTHLVQLARRSNLLLQSRWGRPWNYTVVFRRGG